MIRQYFEIMYELFRWAFEFMLALWTLTLPLLVATLVSLYFAPKFPNICATLPSIQAIVLIAFHSFLYLRISEKERDMVGKKLGRNQWVLLIPLPYVLYLNVEVGWYIFPMIFLQMIFFFGCLYAIAWFFDGCWDSF